VVRAAAVTVDAYGTLVTLRDPVPALRAALRARGVERTHDEVEAAFRAEVDYYVPRSHEGRDEATLALLRRDSAQVFLDAVGADLDAESFAHDLVDALEFEPIAGAVDALAELRDHDIPVAVVSNWDVGLHEHLRRLGLALPVFTSADAGAPKPDPAIFRLALAKLGVPANDAVHIGDSESDREGAERAGMQFLPAPVAEAVRRLFPRPYSAVRTLAWVVLVALLAAGNYATRFAGGRSATRGGRDAVYHYSTALNGILFYALWFAFVYAIAAVDTDEFFALRRPSVSWPRAVALAIGVIVLIYVVSGLVSTLPLPQSPSHEQGLTPTHWRSHYAGAFAANFVVLALLAPIVEELTFRGVGYRLLEPYGRWLAIGAVGAMFGLAHGLVEGLLVLVPFGIAVTWLRSRTDSVYPGMLVHAAFNAIALLSVLTT
jgi:HAD superfamily hydrolase (TIGR01509 family)